MGSANGTIGSRRMRSRWTSLRAWLTGARASEEEDRRRELTLNWILLGSIILALFEALQRVPSVVEGGTGAADHGPTLILSCLAAIAFSLQLAISRRGRQAAAAWSLLAAYYAITTWLFVAEGTEEPVAIVLCAMLIVSGGVLLGTRVAIGAVVVVTATSIAVAALASARVIHPGGATPGVFEQLGLGGGLAMLALVLSARTGERQGSVQSLIAGVAGSGAAMPAALTASLTVRELQVVRLVSLGRSNGEIAQELFLSPRTVHTHVSNALRKTGCTNRTELAVLTLRDQQISINTD